MENIPDLDHINMLDLLQGNTEISRMLTGAEMGEAEDLSTTAPQNQFSNESERRSLIEFQLDELLISLERDQELRQQKVMSEIPGMMQAQIEEEPVNNTDIAMNKLNNKSCRKMKTKCRSLHHEKTPYPMQNGSHGYSSDGSSDIMSSDSNNLSPVGIQPFSPLSVNEADVDSASSCSGGTTNFGSSLPWSERAAMAAVSEHPLPPCRICGDKASGFHYGSNTCEACKGFFRRSLKRKRQYRQSCAGNCPIGSATRSGCAYCRYQKCIASGMSKTAIKTGRYTHEKKARDIEEVRKIKNEISSGDPSSVEKISEKDKINEEFTRKIAAAYNNLESVQNVGSSEKRGEKLKEFMETKAIREEMFGQMAPLSQRQYFEIFNATGIDIDGRRELINVLMKKANNSIKHYINFCKALPRFCELTVEDQMALIKAGRWDFRMLTMFKFIDAENRLFLSYDGSVTLHYDDFMKMGEGWVETIETFFQVSQRIQKVQLHDIEVAFLKAITIFSKDRCNNLKEPEKVEEIQLQCVDALLHHWNKNRPDRRHLMGSIFIILADLRNVSHYQCRAEENIYFKAAQYLSLDICSLAPIIVELLSGPS